MRSMSIAAMMNASQVRHGSLVPLRHSVGVLICLGVDHDC